MGFKFPNFFINLHKYNCIVLSFIMALLSYGGIHFIYDKGAVSTDDSAISFCFYDTTEKVQKNDFIGKKDSYHIYMAKNEYEGCQLVMKAHRKRSDVKLEITDFTDGKGNAIKPQIFEEKYINTTGAFIDGEFPDALVPLANGSEIETMGPLHINSPYYIQLQTTADTVPGDYTATVRLINTEDSDRNGFIEVEAKITATVWNFTLPQTPSCDTAVGLDRGCIAKAHGVDTNSAKAQELYEKYYEYLLSHKISAYGIPVDILSDEADKYLNDPRMTSFLIPYPGDDALLQRYYQKVCSNETWKAKGYFYPIDEPSTEEHYNRYIAITDRLDALCPGYNMVTPFYTLNVKDGSIDNTSVNLQAGKSNILCPISDLYGNKGFKESILARKAEGDKSWWYVCCGPQGDFCNIFTHWDGIKARILFWQQKENCVDGFLYWSTSYWKDVDNIWTDSLTTPWTGNDTFGDGSWFYNGNAVGIDGPVSSLRLESVTDGIEDFEYLTIAEELLGRDYVEKMIANISKNMTNYTLKDSKFAENRIALGNAINEALNK